MSFRLLTGIKPTGTLHLGNYIGAMRPVFSLMQDAHAEAFLFIADGHALTSVHKGEDLRQATRAVAAAWLAMGLDPKRVTFYRQSRVPQVFELFWMLSCLCPKGLMNRAHAYKALTSSLKERESGDVDQNVFMGLYNYPILMAADILLFSADQVPVGADQVQHVEIARDLAQKFNQVYGDVLRVPRAYVQPEMPSLMGLDGRKMSKSYNNVIPLFCTPETLRRLVFKIKTDSKRPEEPKQSAGCSLFSLYKAFVSDVEIKAMEERYQKGLGWAEMKELTFQVVSAYIAPFRKHYEDWMQDNKHLDSILEAGESCARAQAETCMAIIRRRVGFF